MKKQTKTAEFRKTRKRVAAALKAQAKIEREQRLKAARDAREQEKLAKAARKQKLKREREQRKVARVQKKLAAAHAKKRWGQREVFQRALIEGYAHEIGKNLASLRIFDANDEGDFAKARRWIRVARNFIEDLADRFDEHDPFVPIRKVEPVVGQPGLFKDARGRTFNVRDF